MTDLELLFLILAVIYGWECAWWVPRGSVVFHTWLGRRWRISRPSQVLGNHRGGLVWTAFLPPLGTAFLCPTTQPADIGSDPKIHPDPKQLARERFDATELSKRVELFRGRTRILRGLCNGLFVYLFLVAPALISLLGLRRTWVALVVALLALTTSIAIGFWKTHKLFLPALEDERFTKFIIVLLSPATAVRACNLVSRLLLDRYDPLAIAEVLCSQEGFRSYAADRLRELHYPAHNQASGSADTSAAAWHELVISETSRLLARHGLSRDKLLPPPVPEPGSRSYCPRCFAQFTTASGVCADCGGVALQPFS